jgi:hypothetical protein
MVVDALLMSDTLPLLVNICNCRKFSKGEVADLMDVLHRAESEVELQMGDPLREWVWWLSAVSAAVG